MSNHKIMVLCHTDKNFQKIHDLVYSNHINYCAKHGAVYKVIDTKDIISHEPLHKEIYWIKLLALQKELESNSDIDWFFMMDTDCVFLKQDIPLSFFINSANDHDDILACYMGKSIKTFFRINVGAMFFKNTEFVREFIKYWISIGQKSNYTIFEQNCLQDMFWANSMNILDHIGFFPENAFNHGNKNTFLFHACNISTAFTEDSFDNIIQEKIKTIKLII